MHRRKFLQTTGLLTLSFLTGGQGWALRNSNASTESKKLIVVFLRGAVDGLNVVIPYGDPQYYSLRSTIAVPHPGQDMGVLRLDNYFGLHPSLGPIMQQWQDGTLSFVVAAGSPDPTRSHFDAQDYMESGTPGIKITSSGWMNRLLAQLPHTNSPIQAINIGATLPRILQGPMSVASYQPAGGNASAKKPIDNPMIAQYFESMYSNRNDALGQAFNEGLNARKTIKKDLEEEMIAANRGAPDAGSFKGFGSQLGKLFADDPSVQIGFIAIGGWDTHVNQGNAKGQLANKLTTLGDGLNELVFELGPKYKNTIIIVLSEFGRTVKENGNAGTDHGHGNVMMLLGGSINGGKTHGQWPGLGFSQLYEGRDLAVTTDFRSVLSIIIAEHMQVSRQGLETIFPNFSSKNNLSILKA